MGTLFHIQILHLALKFDRAYLSWIAKTILAITVASTAYGKDLLPSDVPKFEKGVVKIVIRQQGVDVSIGAGFFISQDGKLATNYHVIKPALFAQHSIHIISNEGKTIADSSNTRIINCLANTYDFCLLKTNYKPKYFFSLNSQQPKKGEKIYSLGHPHGLEYTLSDGVVSGLHAKEAVENNKKVKVPFVQISAPISPGNSGGPIFDSNGMAMGMSTFIIGDNSAQNLNFALSSSVIRQDLEYFKNSAGRTFYEVEKEKSAAAATFVTKMKQLVIAPALKSLDSGHQLNPKHFIFYKIKFDGLDFSVPVFFEFSKCYEQKDNTFYKLYCVNMADGTPFSYEVRRFTGSLMSQNGKKILKPQPLALTQSLINSGKWKKIESTLTPKQRTYLYSVPGLLNCKKYSKSEFFPDRTICSYNVFNDTYAGYSTYVEAAQPSGKPYIITAAVSTSESKAAGFYYSLAPIAILGTTGNGWK